MDPAGERDSVASNPKVASPFFATCYNGAWLELQGHKFRIAAGLERQGKTIVGAGDI